MEDVVHFEAQLERPKLSNSDPEMFLGWKAESKGTTGQRPQKLRPFFKGIPRVRGLHIYIYYIVPVIG